MWIIDFILKLFRRKPKQKVIEPINIFDPVDELLKEQLVEKRREAAIHKRVEERKSKWGNKYPPRSMTAAEAEYYAIHKNLNNFYANNR